MKPGIVFLLLSLLCCIGCDKLPLADNRARPEPPALPAEMITGDPFVNLTARKMNVVYVGVPNPLELKTVGVDLNELTVMASPPGYITAYEKDYSLNVATPGLQTVKVRQNGKLLKEFTFRAKPIPDPVAKLGNKLSGKMSEGEFTAQRGLIAIHDNFDFEVKCVITAFKLTRNSLSEERLVNINIDGQFKPSSFRSILKARVDDIYTFTDVHAKCPGDKASRTINSLVFEII